MRAVRGPASCTHVPHDMQTLQQGRQAMCGFAGFIHYDTGAIPDGERRRVLAAMGEAIAHRGPDDVQYHDDGVLALVFRRLSIIDPESGRQPFFNEQRDALLVANAEIYNHLELRHALLGSHRFQSRSDCEVLLHGLEQWGIEALQRARGMFALAHWDLGKRKLTLARDRFGIKPLYVCRLPGGLLFGSELKALLAHPQCPRSLAWKELDRESGTQSLQASYVAGVEMLAPGSWLELDTPARTVRTDYYWQLEDHLGTACYGNDAARYTRGYAELLEEAVGQHLQRDVGAGLHLSGGLDSSLLAAVCAASGARLPCFTIVERTSFLEGDVTVAQQLCKRLGLPWSPVKFDYREVAQALDFNLERFEETVWMMDSPRFDLEWLYKSALHGAARAFDPTMKVLLLGQGADEFAGGYSHRLDSPYEHWTEYLRAEVEPYWHRYEASQGRGSESFQTFRAPQKDPAAHSPYHRFMLLIRAQLHHHNLWHEDRTSSWHSLEARVPFLDHRLVELLASVPASLHEQLFWDKRILRDAMQRFMPGFDLPQPKIGFLHGSDLSALNLSTFRLLQAIAPDFRQKYLQGAGDSALDPTKVDALMTKALRRGPGSEEALYRSLQCMSLCVFERHLREPPIGWRAPAAPPLPLMGKLDWASWAEEMPPQPVCGADWRPEHRVVLQEGAEIAVSTEGSAVRFRFLRDGEVAGNVSLAAPHGWEARLLSHLDDAACADFTVQDWMDEFDIGLPTLTGMLDILVHMGVLVAAR